MTTRTGGALAGEVRFGIVKRLHRNLPKTMIEGKLLRIATGLLTHEKGNLLQFSFRLGRPGQGGLPTLPGTSRSGAIAFAARSEGAGDGTADKWLPD